MTVAVVAAMVAAITEGEDERVIIKNDNKIMKFPWVALASISWDAKLPIGSRHSP